MLAPIFSVPETSVLSPLVDTVINLSSANTSAARAATETINFILVTRAPKLTLPSKQNDNNMTRSNSVQDGTGNYGVTREIPQRP